jgi:uncharacterized membrane protein YoaK (UPF0700 family)
MSQLVAPLIMFGLFLAIYAYIHRRGDRTSAAPDWKWLIAVGACAATALIIGAVVLR